MEHFKTVKRSSESPMLDASQQLRTPNSKNVATSTKRKSPYEHRRVPTATIKPKTLQFDMGTGVNIERSLLSTMVTDPNTSTVESDDDETLELTQPGEAPSATELDRESIWTINLMEPANVHLKDIDQTVHIKHSGADFCSGQVLKTLIIGRKNFNCNQPWVKSISRKHTQVQWRWDKDCHCVTCHVKHLGGTGATTVRGIQMSTGDAEQQIFDDETVEVGIVGSGENECVWVKLSIASRNQNFGTTSFDRQYQQLLRSIMQRGEHKGASRGPFDERFGKDKLVFRLRGEGGEMLIPALSLKYVFLKGAATELLWYFRGEDNIKWLQQQDVHFWDKEADENGFVGLNYGLLTNFKESNGERCNQLETIIDELCDGKINSRNLTAIMAKPEKLDQNSKKPVHACTESIQVIASGQVSAVGENGMVIRVNQRSSDVCLGLPFDIVVWSVLLHLICREVHIRTSGKIKLFAEEIIFDFGSAHIYIKNQDLAKIMLQRESRLPANDAAKPFLRVSDVAGGMFDLKPDDLTFYNYGPGFHSRHPGPTISKEMKDVQIRA